MARLRTGYAGRDARGRLVAPVTVDLGPAAAHVSGLAAIGRLSVSRVSEYLQADTAQAAGAGPVERRRATPDELARLAPPTPRPASRSAQDGRDGSSAALSTPAPARTPVPATSRKEEPVTAIPATPSAGITLPCSTCLHEPVCALKAMLDDLEPLEPVQVIDRGLRAVATGYRIECDHHLVSIGTSPSGRTMAIEAPTDAGRIAASRRNGAAATLKLHAERRAAKPAPAAAVGERRYPLPKDPAERDRVVLAAVRATPTVAAAGESLGVSAERIRQVLKGMREAGQLPDDVAELLRARGRAGGGQVFAAAAAVSA